MDIKLSDVTTFASLDSFSYLVEKKTQQATVFDLVDKTYSYSKGFRFSRPELVITKNNEVVIRFQNLITRSLHYLFDSLLDLMKIKHSIVKNSSVMNKLKEMKLITQPPQTFKKTSDYREFFNQVLKNEVNKQLSHKNPSFQSTHPDISQSRQTNDSSKGARDLNRIDKEIFQKYTNFLDFGTIKKVNVTEEDEQASEGQHIKAAKNVIDSIDDGKERLNWYFENSVHTPLTLALDRAHYEVVEYILSKENSDGKQIADPNIGMAVSKNDGTDISLSPLVIAAKKDLPIKFFELLFSKGAKLNELDAKTIKKTAEKHNNARLLELIEGIESGKPMPWDSKSTTSEQEATLPPEKTSGQVKPFEGTFQSPTPTEIDVGAMD